MKIGRFQINHHPNRCIVVHDEGISGVGEGETKELRQKRALNQCVSKLIRYWGPDGILDRMGISRYYSS